jgi:hypothetical protein
MALSITSNNTIYPRFRLSYCPTDSIATMAHDYSQISYYCQINSYNYPSVITTLPNCTIPYYFMSLGMLYYVNVFSVDATNSALNTNKIIAINTLAPSV